MMIQCNNDNSLKSAYTILGGNNFSFDYYKSLYTLKFFTTETIANAVLVLESIGLKKTVDFEIVNNFDYEYPSAYQNN